MYYEAMLLVGFTFDDKLWIVRAYSMAFADCHLAQGPLEDDPGSSRHR